MCEKRRGDLARNPETLIPPQLGEITHVPPRHSTLRSAVCALHRAMLSLLGRDARRLPGVRYLVRASVDSALVGPQVSCHSRPLGTSDFCIYGCDESARRDVHRWAGARAGVKGLVHSLPTACTVGEAWKWASPMDKWGNSAFSLKVAETLQGASRSSRCVDLCVCVCLCACATLGKGMRTVTFQERLAEADFSPPRPPVGLFYTTHTGNDAKRGCSFGSVPRVD